LLNDIDSSVFRLHNFLIQQAKDPEFFFENVKKVIFKYHLSHSFIKDVVPIELKKQWKKTYFAKYNKIGFERLRNDFNKDHDLFKLYVLLIYGFNRMLRFNGKGEYNLPVGNVDFNHNVVNALKDFFNIVSSRTILWQNTDYKTYLESIDIENDDFIYFDPPYLITFSEYNKYWDNLREEELVKTLENLNYRKIRFAVSNVIYYKGKENKIFHDWSKKYFSHPINSNYISYHDNTIKEFKEVLITNY